MPDLDDRAIAAVLDRLDAKDVARCSAVNSSWFSVAIDESRWQRLCDKNLDEQEKIDHLWDSAQHATWHRTYAAYMNKFCQLRLQHADCCVAVRFWQAVRRWAEVNFPELLQTFNPGLRAEAIKQVLAKATHPIPDVLIALHLITDGQTFPASSKDLTDDTTDHPFPSRAARQSVCSGIFGKDRMHRTHNIMPDFARAASGIFHDSDARDAVQQRVYGDVLLTQLQRSPEGDMFSTYAHHLVDEHGPEEGLRAGFFTLSRSNMWPKSVVVDVRQSERCGGPRVLRHNPVEVSAYSADSPAFYQQIIDLVTDRGKERALAEYGNTRAPELCAWLEGFAEQLRSGRARCVAAFLGMYQVNVRFLELVPLMDSAPERVTGGIRVRAQAWATPHTDHKGNVLFSYRVEFSHAASPGEPLPSGMVRRGQLHMRHWDIYGPGDTRPCQEVQGNGVVGDYPVIEPGNSYDYISMCPGQYGGGMEGWFLFLLSGQDETGEAAVLKVLCPRIEFVEPEFLF